MQNYSVVQGNAIAVDVVLRGSSGAEITTYTGAETLSATLATPGNATQLGTPTAAWISPGTGLVRVLVPYTLTAALAPGGYVVTLELTDAGTPVAPYQFYLNVTAGAADGTAPTAPTSKPASGAPATLGTVYCTDEDVAARAPTDFTLLCPGWQRLANGTDGRFTADDPWALQSTGTDFAAAGLAAGHVVWLTRPQLVAPTARGDLYAVDAVDGHAVWLRRISLAFGVGAAPSGGTAVAGVAFTVLTFAPQIDKASFDANQFFGVEPAVAVLAPGRLWDRRELRQFTVLTVLKDLYTANVKGGSGDYQLRLAAVVAEWDMLRSGLVARWTDDRNGQPAARMLGKVRVVRG